MVRLMLKILINIEEIVQTTKKIEKNANFRKEKIVNECTQKTLQPLDANLEKRIKCNNLTCKNKMLNSTFLNDSEKLRKRPPENSFGCENKKYLKNK